MKLLEDRIQKDGIVKEGNILRVDSFINHQMDVDLLDKIGEEFYRLFKDCGATKILTIEASGIGIACMTARYFHIPVVFAKKSQSSNLAGDMYCANVKSFTYNKVYNVVVSKKYMTKEDKILIIDDFLAEGNAMLGLLNLAKQAGADVVGAGAVIEKGFEPGEKIIKDMGINLHSLAIVESMDPVKGIVFRH